MATGTQQKDVSPKAETKCSYSHDLRGTWQMDDNLENANTQQTGAYPRAVDMQRTVNLKVVAEQQTNTNPWDTSAQRTGIYPRVVNKQRTVKLRVVARSGAGKNSITESAHPNK